MSLVYVCIIIACSSLRMRENCFTLATDFQNGCLFTSSLFSKSTRYVAQARHLPDVIGNLVVMLSHGHKSVRACANCRKRRKICEWYEMT
ncbi:uncharacterized protein LOC126916888 isoform X6 [Bombus affinis]|uniref:uncharacterized protein LOC126916888 isoform X6 n=1 Tax=Bombus affinis TaxID=309941 RepID=UPI0021B7C6F7|nr:uncharacterized protein LOC126916888 isoform X6 [Bombus affinis]